MVVCLSHLARYKVDKSTEQESLPNRNRTPGLTRRFLKPLYRVPTLCPPRVFAHSDVTVIPVLQLHSQGRCGPEERCPVSCAGFICSLI